ncbi:MAG TPA: DUF3108 domain-containing protein [Thermoanaerobaculia bacterium]|nr:DUF3108 domain-containing protein [Thermoanaerobaculia bacterium]
MKRWLLIAILAMASPAVADVQDIFVKGETLDFELTWLLVTGGGMRMTIGPVPNDPAHFRITSIAKSSSSFSFIFKVRDAMTSIVNRDDFSTIRYEKHLNERGRRKDDTTIIDERRKIATRRRPNHDTEQIIVPKPVFDPLSLVYHLRSLDLRPGNVHRFTVFADGKVYTLEANVARTETIGTPMGTFKTIVVEPKMLAGGLFRDEGTLTIWYSDDARHIPVRIRSELKVGSITANLRGIRNGAADPEPDTGR